MSGYSRKPEFHSNPHVSYPLKRKAPFPPQSQSEDREVNEGLANQRNQGGPPTVRSVAQPVARRVRRRTKHDHPARNQPLSTAFRKPPIIQAAMGSSNSIPLGRPFSGQAAGNDIQGHAGPSTGINNAMSRPISSRGNGESTMPLWMEPFTESAPYPMPQPRASPMQTSSSPDASPSTRTLAPQEPHTSNTQTPQLEVVVKQEVIDYPVTFPIEEEQVEENAAPGVVTTVKEELSFDPQSPALSPPITQQHEGCAFIPMLPQCILGVPGYVQARHVWRSNVAKDFVKLGRTVSRTIIRADGMAVDWAVVQPQESAPIASSNDAQLEPTAMSDHQDVDYVSSMLNDDAAYGQHTPSPRPSGLGLTLGVKRTSLAEGPGDWPGRSGVPPPFDGDLPSAAAPRLSESPHATPKDTFGATKIELESTALPGNLLDGNADASWLNRRSPSPELPATPIPIYEESFDMTIQRFLLQYFRIFDANRPTLRAVYDHDALFSYQVVELNGEHLLPNASSFAPIAAARNLRGATSSAFLRRGPQAIIEAFSTMKSWIHASPQGRNSDANVVQRFVWDVSKLPSSPPIEPVAAQDQEIVPPDQPARVLLVCHGDLVDPAQQRDRASFDRSFMLKENLDPATQYIWPYTISSDQLTIRRFSRHPPKDLFCSAF